MKEKTICRGDLFYYDFGTRTGSVQSGTRPVLVIQADDYNRNAPTIIVAAVTGVIKKRYLPSHILLGQEFGLKKPSMVLLEQLQTVNKDELRDYIGTIEDEQLLRRINITLKKTFGLWIYKEEKKENIRCLCSKCLKDYIHNPDYIVRRLDPFAKVNLKINTGDFLSFADYFFDGFVVDWMVQDRINNARHQVEEAIRRTEYIINQLQHM